MPRYRQCQKKCVEASVVEALPNVPASRQYYSLFARGNGTHLKPHCLQLLSTHPSAQHEQIPDLGRKSTCQKVNREIAESLGITEQVVKNYLYKIYGKVRVENRLELALWYERQIHEGKLRRQLT
jgi:DNA-binding NarL/FixJ family response regulator